jgi:hypothetical protein
MSESNFKSAGVRARTINQTGPTSIKPAGLPAGVIGTSDKGPAFIPVTVATSQDFVVDFGLPADERSNGPLASIEWLRNSQALTFLRVLGAGSGHSRELSGDNAGKVAYSGFVVGNQLPQRPGGGFGNNQYVVTPGLGDEGRAFILGCFMKQSGSSELFSEAGLATEGVPVVRGILMAASGVFMTLSSSRASSNAPGTVGSPSTSGGAVTGSVNLVSGRQEFVVILNGFENSLSNTYKNSLTASFDPTATNYLDKIFNTNPYKLEEAGHVLYTDYKVYPNYAFPTGSGIVQADWGLGAVSGSATTEDIAFLLTSSMATRNSGSTTVPNFENFEDRYRTAESVWVTSQKFGGSSENLFKVSALSDGSEPNAKIKFSIENILPETDSEPYGSFDLIVRDFYDTDKTQMVLESWRGLNLNPDSPRFIGKIIGDTKEYYNFDASDGSQKIVTEGIFENKSRYVRVEMANKVLNGELDSSAVPFGFRGAPHLVTSGSAPMPSYSDSTYLSTTNPFHNTVQIPVPLRETLARGVSPNKSVDKGLYWGVQFEEKTTVSEPNARTAVETNILSLTKYYPNFHTNFQNVVVSNNQGTSDTAENGILDADRFLNNGFSLGNIRITINSTTGLPDSQTMSDWEYVREGNVVASGSYRALTVSDLSDSTVRNVAKFSFFIHGGFDGLSIFDRDMFNMTNESVTEEMNFTSRGISNGPTVSAYNKALDIMADSTEVDIQLLTVPGIRHEAVTDKGLLVTEDRFDALFLLDVDEYDVQNTLVTSSNQIVSVRNTATNFATRGLNTSFGSAYFPNVVLRDSFTGKTRVVPPSVAVLGAYAKNDAVGYPWFAPAGFTRGALETTDEAAMQLSRPNMDALQDVDINPLVSFAGSSGVVIWGQKTLLQSDSSLERVNVRRLLIDIRRKVKAIGNRFLFEANRTETLARFSQLINPVLKKVQEQKGLEKYLVRIDASTTTQADVENKIIRGKIFLTPTKTLEVLSLDFVVSNNA